MQRQNVLRTCKSYLENHTQLSYNEKGALYLKTTVMKGAD